MGWDIEKVDKLKKLWGKGNTASQIAEIIGDVTRNAVIGKAHRLNLATRISSSSIKKNKDISKNFVGEKIKKQSRKSKFKSLLLDKNFEPENPTKLEDLIDGNCRWPLGEKMKPASLFCGRKSIEKFPYCKLHLLYAYQPKNAKEEDIVSEEDIPKFIQKKIKSG